MLGTFLLINRIYKEMNSLLYWNDNDNTTMRAEPIHYYSRGVTAAAIPEGVHPDRLSFKH